MVYPSWVTYFNPHMIRLFFLALSTGIPVTLGVDTFKVWMMEEGYPIAWIALINLVSLPYLAKFLFGPIVDQLEIPYLHKRLGRRRSWSVVSQAVMFLSFLFLGFSAESENISIAVVALCVISGASALNTTVLSAYRIETVSYALVGVGSVTVGFGYRLGKLIASSGALLVAAYFGWLNTYLILPSLLLVTIVITLCSPEPEPKTEKEIQKKNPFFWHVVRPFVHFMKQHPSDWKVILAFIAIFGVGDFLVEDIQVLFFLDIGFSKVEIANIAKAFGLTCTIVGGVIGGHFVTLYGVRKMMVWVTLAHGLSYTGLIVLSMIGKDIFWLTGSIVFEYITAGIKTSLIVSFISILCGKTYYTASQYALFSTVKMALRPLIGSLSGVIATTIGWSNLFVVSIVLSLIPLFLYYRIQRYWEHHAS
jgi:PAT family beta-lactamase induction signal transducer AmpG